MLVHDSPAFESKMVEVVRVKVSDQAMLMAATVATPPYDQESNSTVGLMTNSLSLMSDLVGLLASTT